jgi:hypothetical protein
MNEKTLHVLSYTRSMDRSHLVPCCSNPLSSGYFGVQKFYVAPLPVRVIKIV